MDQFQSLGAPSRSRFGVFKLSKPKRLRARHGLPHRISEGAFVYRAISELDVDAAWGTWLGEQRGAHGELRPVLLKHTGDGNRTRAGADALWLEALLTSKLEGPQVVPLVDYGVVDGRPFAVYEFEEGVFLAQVLEGLRERDMQLPCAVGVAIVLQACDLVGRLHELRLDDEEDSVGGFIHGSLCPRNFVLSGRGDVRVMGLVGVRPVGRVVGREHVPPAAVEYASPDLLGGAPVTPAVDVYSLCAVLAELIGSDPVSGDELDRQVRQILDDGKSGRFSTVRSLSGALQDAVRRTGTVVARQSIAAQVREICEHYLLERHKQVRALLDTEWPDQREPSAPDSEAVAASGANSSGEEARGEAEQSQPGLVQASSTQAASDEAQLGQYDEDADDAVTRFMDDVAAGTEASGQAPAWMNDNQAPNSATGGFSKWAVGGLVGVLVAIGSIAAVVALGSGEVAPPGPVAEAAVQDVVSATGDREMATVSADSLPEAMPSSALPETELKPPVVEAPAGDEAAAVDDAVAVAEPEAEVVDEPAAAPRSVSRARRQSRRRPRSVARAAAPRRSASQNSRVSNNGQYDPMAVELPDTVVEKVAAVEVRTERAPEIAREMAEESDIEYEEAPKMAFLSVDASPYANVFIDGKKVGVTPIVSMELAPGPHRMVAMNEDGETKRYTLMLEAGRTETVRISW